MAVPFNKYYTMFLRDGSDSKEMAIDGSITPVEFGVTIPPGFKFNLHAANLVMSTNKSIDMSGFGSGDPLVGGMGWVYVDQDGNVFGLPGGLDPDNNERVYTNLDFASYVGIDIKEFPRAIVFRWDATESIGGRPLEMGPGGRLLTTVGDNLTSRALSFTMAIEGLIIGEQESATRILRDVFPTRD
jgi:hypothetical protein